MGALFLAVIALFAYICVTYIIEAMAWANAWSKMQDEETSALVINQNNKKRYQINILIFFRRPTKDAFLRTYYSTPFAMVERIEIGKMVEYFLGTIGKILFYIILVVRVTSFCAYFSNAVVFVWRFGNLCSKCTNVLVASNGTDWNIDKGKSLGFLAIN